MSNFVWTEIVRPVGGATIGTLMLIWFVLLLLGVPFYAFHPDNTATVTIFIVVIWWAPLAGLITDHLMTRWKEET